MIIKNVSRFLATAVIVGSSLLMTPLDAQAQSPSLHETALTATAFENFDEGLERLMSFRANNVMGREVKLLPHHAMNAQDTLAYKAHMGSNFAINGLYKGQAACVLFVDTEDTGKPYHVNIRPDQSGVLSLVDRSAYMYYVLTHEMSHCLNHDNYSSLTRLVDLAKDPATSKYITPLSALEMSMREVHADLSAALLGASKTGDWTVLEKAILPMRTLMYDPTHATANSVTAIVNEINPKHLMGQSYEAIAALSNELFKKQFMDKNGMVDPHSNGARQIMKDWYAGGLETEAYIVNQSFQTEMDKQLLDEIHLFREFAGTMMPASELTKLSDVTFLFALKQTVLEQQNQLVEGGAQLGDQQMQDFKNYNDSKSQNLATILSMYKGDLTGDAPSLKAVRNGIKNWHQYFAKAHGSMILRDALPKVLAETLTPPGDEIAAERIRAAEDRVKQMLAQVHGNDQLPADHMVSGLQQADQPSIRTEKSRSLRDVFSFGLR